MRDNLTRRLLIFAYKARKAPLINSEIKSISDGALVPGDIKPLEWVKSSDVCLSSPG
jgi:hypothetical protein